MRQSGFSIIELLIGLSISLLLVSAMAVFIGEASYGFQSQKDVTRDRGQIRRSLSLLARDLMEIGVGADENGQIMVGATQHFFFEFDKSGPNGTAVVNYWQVTDSMDVLASQDPAVTRSYVPVNFVINDNRTDPVTGDAIMVLERNAEPFLIGVSDFQITLGVDLNDDGIISEDTGEWIADPPVSEAEKQQVYGRLKKIRLSVSSQTPVLDGQTVVNTITQEVLLRNRGVQ